MKNGDINVKITKGFAFIQHISFYLNFFTRLMIYDDFKTEEYITDDTFCWYFDFKLNKLPTKSNVRKNYKIGDKVYFIDDDKLYYGEISGVLAENLYYINYSNVNTSMLVPKDIIIPSDWWILHERCTSAIHETSKCLLRLRIYKDLRVLIAKYIWESRNDEEWGY